LSNLVRRQDSEFSQSILPTADSVLLTHESELDEDQDNHNNHNPNYNFFQLKRPISVQQKTEAMKRASLKCKQTLFK